MPVHDSLGFIEKGVERSALVVNRNGKRNHAMAFLFNPFVRLVKALACPFSVTRGFTAPVEVDMLEGHG